jgi:hypothetical protein
METERCMTIHLNAEQERVIAQAIQADVIRDADDIVDVGIETIRQRLEARFASRAGMDAEQWAQEFHAWVHGHSASTPLLSDEAISRDSVYGTSGF